MLFLWRIVKFSIRAHQPSRFVPKLFNLYNYSKMNMCIPMYLKYSKANDQKMPRNFLSVNFGIFLVTYWNCVPSDHKIQSGHGGLTKK